MQKTKSLILKIKKMKLAVFAHCAIDIITINGSNYEQIGGSACYCGITARQFKFDVDLFTKFGPDFPKQYLIENKINFINSESEKNTTKFAITINGSDRVLKLENECDPLDYSKSMMLMGILLVQYFMKYLTMFLKKLKMIQISSSLILRDF